MKKIIIFLIVFITTLTLVGCDNSTVDEVDEYANHKQILSIINNYSIEESNGFEYSLEQKLNETVVNAHTITIKLDHTNGTIGSREEYKKDLNEDITKGQYTELNATAYYKNNKIATYSNDELIWKDCTLEEFAYISINSFKFDINYLCNISLSESGNNVFLSFGVEDAKAASFLGVSGNVKNLTFEIKTDTTYSKLVSFKMSYSQDLTSTYFSFEPYLKVETVEIPE